MDGLKEIHEENRGPKSYDRTIAGIQSLREVVDNITVISVVDRTNFEKWPELTYRLIEMGVKQHHLCPVCFAGRAMEKYKGLTEKQFANIRSKVDDMEPFLPEDFKLVFNDILIKLPRCRTLPITAFVEKYKGWHFVIKSDGKVDVLVKAWGRSWRENETLGNVKNEKMLDLIERTRTQRERVVGLQFRHKEELKRKYHFSNPSKVTIDRDKADVQAVNNGSAESVYSRLMKLKKTSEEEKIDEIFGLPLQPLFSEISKSMVSAPTRFRARKERDFGFLFDRDTFNITLLTEKEVNDL